MSNVQIGSIYNLGINFGDDADFEVVSIKKDVTQGLQATLEMIDFGGPRQVVSVSLLETLVQVSR